MQYKIISLGIFTALAFGLSAGPAAAECAPFPKVNLWGDYTHAKVKSYVAAKLDGDWAPYLARLDKRLDALRRIQSQDKPLTMKFRGKKVVLRGSKRDAYVAAAAARVSVARCLATEADADSLDNFATAAGSVRALPRTTEPRLTSISRHQMNLKVVSDCRAGVATFKVTNQGQAWPKAGIVGIYRRDGDNPRRISKRRIRFAAGQTSSFRIKSAEGKAGDLAMWISPGWANGDFTEDATLSCS